MCGCGGAAPMGGGSAADGSGGGSGPLLSGTLSGIYSTPPGADAANTATVDAGLGNLSSLKVGTGFWITVFVVIGSAWALSWIAKAKKPE